MKHDTTGHFTNGEWAKIEQALDADSEKFGMPEGGREKSLILSSFNIRKLSSNRGRKREIDFMARFYARCDLIAVQEIQDNLDGLFHLKEHMESRIAEPGGYGQGCSVLGTIIFGLSPRESRFGFSV